MFHSYALRLGTVRRGTPKLDTAGRDWCTAGNLWGSLGWTGDLELGTAGKLWVDAVGHCGDAL